MKWYHLDVRDMTKEQYDEYYAMADEARRKKADACRQIGLGEREAAAEEDMAIAVLGAVKHKRLKLAVKDRPRRKGCKLGACDPFSGKAMQSVGHSKVPPFKRLMRAGA